MSKYRLPIAAALLLLIAAIFWFGLYDYLTLDFFRAQQASIQQFVNENLLLSIAVFFAVYVSATAISLPVAGVFCVVAGALYGMVLGTVVISFASTIGATVAFTISRFLLQDYVDGHFAKATKIVNEGIEKDGPYYLFSLRLVPAFPYFVINLVMGLTHMRVWTFAWVTQVSLLPINLVLTNAGEQFSTIESLGDIISPGVMGSLVLIGLFPLTARKLLSLVQSVRPS